MIKVTTGNKPADHAARRQVIEKFIEKSLTRFAERKSAAPVIERVEGETRTILWRWFINHFFFVERGRIGDSPEYMSLVRRQGADAPEEELVITNINLPDKWRVLSANTKTWGQHLFADVERNEPAVIRAMIGFLFDQGYIVADVENGDEDGADEEAFEAEICGRCGTAKLAEICQNPEGCDRHICEATAADNWCCSCVQDEALSYS